MIKFENVYFGYEKEKWVVEDLSFSVNKGEFVSLIGCNGSGKSTIARLSSGLLVSQQGKISIDRVYLSEPSDINICRRKVGIVFQNPDNQFIGMTVEEDLAFGLENFNIGREEAHQRVADISKTLKIDKYLNFPPTMLSGGEKQKVAIAGALVLYPEYLVLDEITSLLDPQGREDILRVVQFLIDKKEIGVLFITHRPEEAMKSNKIIVISEGGIAFQGAPKEVFRNVLSLTKIGVSVPPQVLLSYELNERGFGTDISFSEEEILRELC